MKYGKSVLSKVVTSGLFRSTRTVIMEVKEYSRRKARNTRFLTHASGDVVCRRDVSCGVDEPTTASSPTPLLASPITRFLDDHRR